MTLIDIYTEAGQNHRFYLDWRYKLLSGFLLIISGLAIAYWNTQFFFSNLILIIGIILSIIFYMMDTRIKTLYQLCQEVGASIEKSSGILEENSLYTNFVNSKVILSHTHLIRIIYILSGVILFFLLVL